MASVVGIVGVQPASANTRTDAWGTVELNPADWLGGAGVTVYSNGATATGPSPDTLNYVTIAGGASVQSGIEWQCVELVNRLYLTKGWITARWAGNGGQMYDTAPSGLTKEAQSNITYINPGDVIVLSDGDLGHVGIVDTVTDNGNGTKAVHVVNQNTQNVRETATWNVAAKTVSSYFSGYSMVGVVHAPGSGSTAPTPQETALLQKELSTPAMIQRASGETDVVATSSANSLYFYYNAPGTASFGSVPVATAGHAFSTPAIVQRPNGESLIAVLADNNRLDLYVNTPGTITFSRTSITANNMAYSAPAMVLRPNGEVDVAVMGPGNSLDFYISNPDLSFGRLTAAPAGSAYSTPAMVQRASGETDIAVVGANKRPYYYFNAPGSSTFTPLSIAGDNTAYSAPAMVLRPSGEVDVAMVGPDHRIDYYFNGQGSTTFGYILATGNNQAYSAPAIVVRSNGEVNLTAEGPSTSLIFCVNTPNSPYFGQLGVAGNGTTFSAQAMVQRSSGETDIAAATATGWRFYYNAQGSSSFGYAAFS